MVLTTPHISLYSHRAARASSRRGLVSVKAIPLLLLTLPLIGCGYSQSKASHQAQYNMIGMTEADLDACAGPPDKVTKINTRTNLDTYVYKPASTGGFTIQLPLSLGGVSLGGSGSYCSASMRLVDGRVSEVHYTGDDDKMIGSDGVCEPLIRGCLRQIEQTELPLKGPNKAISASAFHSPAVPTQSDVSEAPATTTPQVTTIPARRIQ